MASTPSPDALIDLLDQAVGMAAGHLSSEQRAELWTRTEKAGLAELVARRCSPGVQRVLLSERPRVNPDGGGVGEASEATRQGREGETSAQGSAKASAIPTE